MTRWEDVEAQLIEDRPELAAELEELEPARVVSREVLRARAELGISQAELARRMGTAQSVVSRLENMEGSPNMRTVFALARALDREVELRFVDPTASKLEVGEVPDWALGTREEFIEGLTLLVSQNVAEMTGALRRAIAEFAPPPRAERVLDPQPGDDVHVPEEALAL